MKDFLYYFLILAFLSASLCGNAQGTMTIGSGTTFVTTTGTFVNLQNTNLSVNSTFIQPTASSRFVFSGTTDNTISGSTSPQFNELEISKTSGSLLLAQNISIASTVNFTSGNINLGNSNLLLMPTASLNGESASSRLLSAGTGYASITITLNAPSAINPGNLGAVITSTQNLGSTQIRRGFTSQTSGFGTGGSILRYYDILPTNNTALNATLRINYLDAELNGLNESTFTLFKSTNNTTWINQNFTARNATLNYVELAGISDFSRWTLSTANNALPVTITSFTAAAQNCKMALSWKTANELAFSYFELERGINGFSKIATITAKGSNGSYDYLDDNPIAGNNLYRLKMVDKDGSYTYSNVISTNINCATMSVAIWPNPTRSSALLNGTSVGNLITVSNNLGQQIMQRKATGASEKIDLSAQHNGVYVVKITDANGQRIATFKLLKIN